MQVNQQRDPNASIAAFATLAATFYNHLVMAGVPDDAAAAMAQAYVAEVTRATITAYNAQSTPAHADYGPIREYIFETVRNAMRAKQ